MSETAQRILREALQLPTLERQKIARCLIESMAGDDHVPMEEIDPAVWNAWRTEIRRRMESYLRGESHPIDAEVVFSELRSKYGP